MFKFNRWALLVLLSLVIFLNAFSLPAFSFWKSYGFIAKEDPVVKTGLFHYQHPFIPSPKDNTPPQLISQNYILLDLETNTILTSKNPHAHIYPASITKLATALTALNLYPLDEEVTVSQEYKEGKVMELVSGERITVRSLVEALLIYSANDAGFNLASHHPQGIDGFVSQMNLIAQKYELKNTHFTNYDGIHHPDHYSSVYDLSQLGRISVKNSVVRQVVKTKELEVRDIDGLYSHQLISTNELLGVVPEVEGLKTGWTPEAGGCFIGLINLNGRYLISVVAQSEDRFADTKSLIQWAQTHVVYHSYPNIIN